MAKNAAGAIIDCTEALFRKEYEECLHLKLADDHNVIQIRAQHMPSDPLFVLTRRIEQGLVLADPAPFQSLQPVIIFHLF